MNIFHITRRMLGLIRAVCTRASAYFTVSTRKRLVSDRYLKDPRDRKVDRGKAADWEG